MASVYILYSQNLNKFYIGSCKDIDARLAQHNSGEFKSGYTTRANDWVLYLSIANLEYQQARKIEQHLKKMKSKVYLMKLKLYSEMRERLIAKFHFY